ncbi:MAG: hypothetical protein AAF566_10495 [Pseudomonadota bacterium]
MKRSVFVLAFALLTSPAVAQDVTPKMRAYFETEISTWSNNPVLVDAIRAQNAKTQGYSQSQIDEMDLEWRAQIGTADSSIIGPVLNNDASEFLRSVVNDAGGVITEVFAMDARGLNVAASDVTSDYWQGDEAKFTETYPNGAGAVHFGEIEFDDSSQSYQGQISFTVVDPNTSEVVGAMTVGVNAEVFF